MAPLVLHLLRSSEYNIMISTLFLQYLTSVISLGLSCGTCCSPLISVFLSAYTVTHARNVKRAMKIFFEFFLGKLTAIVLLCVFTSFLKRQWINEDGSIGNINMYYFVEISLLLLGVFLICRWIYQKKKQAVCRKCSQMCMAHMETASSLEERENRWPPYAAGFIYGVYPCPPIMLLIGYALMLSIGKSIILATVFTIVSSFTPMLIMVFSAGILSKRMYEEIPKLIDWIRLICYILFVAIVLFMLLTDL
jgi:sulfite exporter TauE/SafE